MKPRYLIPIVLVVALLVVGQLLGGCLALERWFAPAAVTMTEAYAADTSGPQVDHGTFDRLLKRVVTAAGRVRYEELRQDPTDLDVYLGQLAKVDFAALPRNEKLALLINAYNAFTLRLILDFWPIDSIRDIPAAKRWDDARWRLGDLTLSLTAIEHEYLRARFVEPRIHFAVNCASVGCPPLRAEAFRGDAIETQLQEQTVAMHRDPAWVELTIPTATIRLTRLYLWYESDFVQAAGTALDYAARFHPGLAEELAAGRRPAIEWIEYDWALNVPKR